MGARPSAALLGIEGIPLEVEVDIGPGLPAFNIVGLPDAAVQESRERVRAAIRNAGFEFPLRRITVNLAPADVRKEGPIYDLPIAVGVLVASEQMGRSKSRAARRALAGWALRHAHGVLPIVAMCPRASACLVPAEDVPRPPRRRARGHRPRHAAPPQDDPSTWDAADRDPGGADISPRRNDLR